MFQIGFDICWSNGLRSSVSTGRLFGSLRCFGIQHGPASRSCNSSLHCVQHECPWFYAEQVVKVMHDCRMAADALQSLPACPVWKASTGMSPWQSHVCFGKADRVAECLVCYSVLCFLNAPFALADTCHEQVGHSAARISSR